MHKCTSFTLIFPFENAFSTYVLLFMFCLCIIVLAMLLYDVVEWCRTNELLTTCLVVFLDRPPDAFFSAVFQNMVQRLPTVLLLYFICLSFKPGCFPTGLLSEFVPPGKAIPGPQDSLL